MPIWWRMTHCNVMRWCKAHNGMRPLRSPAPDWLPYGQVINKSTCMQPGKDRAYIKPITGPSIDKDNPLARLYALNLACAFLKSSFFSHSSRAEEYPNHCTKNYSFLPRFLCALIASTSYSSWPSNSTGSGGALEDPPG